MYGGEKLREAAYPDAFFGTRATVQTVIVMMLVFKFSAA